MIHSLKTIVRFHKSLSEDIRIRLIFLLCHHGKLSVSDCMLITGYTQSAVTRHLIYMANAGLLESEKRGKFVFYYLDKEARAYVEKEFSFIKDEVLTKDLAKLKDLHKKGELTGS